MTPAAKPRLPEPLMMRLAARQHGLVTRTQLLDAGITRHRVDRRVATKQLRPVHRGVYQVGPLVSPRAREMAAVLASGAGACVSHRSAAVMWELVQPDVSAPVHVTVAGGDRGRRPGIIVHRVSDLDPSDVREVDGIPLTAPARTLFDLAGLVRGRELEQAAARAEKQGLTNRWELLSLVSCHSRRYGIRALRRLLDDGPLLARSEAEERFLALIRKARLPAPASNTRLGGYEVDFLWSAERVVVEVDGFAFHSSRRTFESDRRRDADLSAMGFRVVRVTWRQLIREPESILVRLAQTLARSDAR